MVTQANNFNDSKVYGHNGSKVMDGPNDSKIYKRDDSKTDRLDISNAFKASLAHGLSKFINYDEET
jgi:hypothetical protein